MVAFLYLQVAVDNYTPRKVEYRTPKRRGPRFNTNFGDRSGAPKFRFSKSNVVLRIVVVISYQQVKT